MNDNLTKGIEINVGALDDFCRKNNLPLIAITGTEENGFYSSVNVTKSEDIFYMLLTVIISFSKKNNVSPETFIDDLKNVLVRSGYSVIEDEKVVH
jgi:hypothetical protein